MSKSISDKIILRLGSDELIKIVYSTSLLLCYSNGHTDTWTASIAVHVWHWAAPGFALFSHCYTSPLSDVWHSVSCLLYCILQVMANTGLSIVYSSELWVFVVCDWLQYLLPQAEMNRPHEQKTSAFSNTTCL